MNDLNCEKNSTTNCVGENFIGKIFVAKNNFPMELEDDKEMSYDIQVGEKIKVESYENGEYKLLNLSLENSDVWVIVDSKDLANIINENNIITI